MLDDYEKFLYSFLEKINNPEFSETILIPHSYILECKKGKYINENTDLKDFRAQERYNRFIKFVASKQIPVYTLEDFNKIETKNVLKIFHYLINEIFGDNNIINSELADFSSKISLNNTNEPMNGMVSTMFNTLTNERKTFVNVPSMDDVSSIICLAHEFIHYHYEINNKFMYKQYYNEILSILIEKVASQIVNTFGIEKDIIKKIECVRLDAIKFHYTDSLQDIKEVKAFFKTQSSSDIEHFKRVIDEYNLYHNSLAQSYGIGYIYSEKLFDYYNNDKNFTEKLRKTFYFDETLQTLLDFYGINLNNKQIFEDTKEKVRKILK